LIYEWAKPVFEFWLREGLIQVLIAAPLAVLFA
jgi:hypothetical protein